MALKHLLAALALLTATWLNAAQARDYLYIVGSSTVFPFATTVAETFGRNTEFKTPKVEATGTGGGMKLFCGGVGQKHPDIANASRRIKQAELARCAKNGVTDVIEVKIGYDGIALANSKEAPEFNLSLRDLYLALAKDVPNPDGSQTLVANPYDSWAEINPALPAQQIEVLGPPPTSGTRDAFAELALEGGCRHFDWIAAMEDQDEARYKSVCHTVREDGGYVEAGENDNLIVQKLVANPGALGIFGFSFLDQNTDRMHGAQINGVPPTFDNIASGDYPISRSLYIYAKQAHVDVIPGMREFLREFTSGRAWGDFGYLTDKGLIPMPPSERAKYRQAVEKLKPLQSL